MRPITVNAGGLAAASATKISLSQSVPGATAVVIDGAAASGYSATSVATTTNNGASTTTVTLNGSTVVSGVALIIPPAPIVLVSAGNDSSKTWTVTGLGADNKTSVVETVAAANASRVATKNAFAQVISIKLSSGSAGNVSAGTNGVATLDKPRQVILTSGGADTGITFTITGTNCCGNAQSEVVTGASVAAATSVLDYLTVTSIVASGATASTLTVGTNTVSGAYWVFLDQWASRGCALQVTVSGTVNYTVQSTFDDPNDPMTLVTPSGMTWVNTSDTAAVNATATLQTSYAYTPKYVRVLVNSGTGTATATVTQALNAPF